MSNRLLLLLFVLISGVLYAQSDVNQLIKQLNASSNDSVNIEVYNKLYQYYYVGKPDSANYFIEKGLEFFTDKKSKKGIASMYSLQGEFAMSSGNLELAKRFKLDALKIFTEINYTRGIALCKNGLGTIEGKFGNIKEATVYFMEALRGFESINNTKGIIATYLKLGLVNDLTNNFKKSLEYYNSAIKLSEGLPLSSNLLNLYNNIGIVYFKTGDRKKALDFFNLALSKSNDNEFAKIKILSYTNLGNAYKQMGADEKALAYMDKALLLCSPEVLPEDYARLIENKASIIAKKDPVKALASLKEAMAVVKKLGDKPTQLEIYIDMIEVYKMQNNYKDAFLSLDASMRIQDTLYGIEREKAITDLQSIYELEKSKSKVQQLEVSDKENTQLINIIILIAFGLFFTLMALYSFYLKSKELNKELTDRSNELQKTNTVKDRLFSVIGHDLRGPISNIPLMLELYHDETTSNEERTFILDSIKENIGISLETLDKLLHWGKSQIKGISIEQTNVNVNDNLKDILVLIKSISNSKQISIINHIHDDVYVFVDPNHLNFIFRNLLANAVKFTHHNGLIEINASKEGLNDKIIFSVKDNGIGIDKNQQESIFELFNVSTTGTDNEKGYSIGLMLCKEFVVENGGEIWVQSEKGNGTTIYFSLKIAHNLPQNKSSQAFEFTGRDNP